MRQCDRGLLVLLLLATLLLPLFTPRLYATDSVQYYAYLRSLFFDGDLDFANEYSRFHQLNPSAGIDKALLPRLDPGTGKLRNVDPTTGKLVNVAPIGSAILWTPAFLLAHGGVLLARSLGSTVAADGYSQPYIVAICLASVVYGLLGLLLSYRIARRFVGAWAATAATIVCWLASPLVFYMYISPPWSHTGGLFATALFIWYWLQTRPRPTLRQWLVLGALGGLMVLVREQLGLFLLLPALDALAQYIRAFRTRAWPSVRRDLLAHSLFLVVIVLTLTPQLLTYYTLTGRWGPSAVVLDKLLLGVRGAGATPQPEAQPQDVGGHGLLGSAHFWDTLIDVDPSPVTQRPFSHGALLWTPAWALGLLGLALLWRRNRGVATILLLAVVAQTWVNGAFGTTWHLSGAFGFRRLIEATPLFVLGVAVVIEQVRLPRGAWAVLGALLIFWNIGLIYQWTFLGAQDRQYREGLVWNGMLARQAGLPVQLGTKMWVVLFERADFYDSAAPTPVPPSR